MDNLKRSASSDAEHDDIQDSKRQRLNIEEKLNIGDKREKVINVIKREFQNEITKRQEEVHLIQQRLLKAQKTLHLLKYVIIKSFYDKKELNITNTEESIIKQSGKSQGTKNASTRINVQNRIHPAVKKLLGKKPVESVTYDFARTRGQVQNFQTFVKQEIVKETNDSPQQNTVDEKQDIPQPTTITKTEEIKVPVRNRQKIKHDVVIGNISKYSPANNQQDASTHKWMVYVRGPRDNPDISHFVKKVRFFLHPSYQPNDIVDLEEAPFHLSRRGWGEFPLRIQIHFQNSLNKAVDVIHNLKLDQNRTGRQTLGHETLLNVWLYDTSTEINIELLNESEENNDIYNKKIKKENIDTSINTSDTKKEIKEEISEINENFSIKKEPEENYELLEIFNPGPSCSKNNTLPQINRSMTKNNTLPQINKNYELLNIFNPGPSCSKNNTLPQTNRILKNNTVPQIIKNDELLENFTLAPNCSKNNKASQIYQRIYKNKTVPQTNKIYELLEIIPELSCSKIYTVPQINTNYDNNRDYNLIYLVDHCYTGAKIDDSILLNLYKSDIDREKYKFSIPLSKFSSTRQIVYFLFKKLPLVTKLANDLSYKCCYPYVASSVEEYSSWNIAKRCCSEWYRAKQIKNMLKDHKIEDEEDWSTKFILMFGRAHAFTPMATYAIFQNKSESGKTLPDHSINLDIKSTLTEYIPISTLMENSLNKVEKDEDEDEIIDIENISENIKEPKVKRKIQLASSESDPDMLPLCNYVKNCAGQLDIYLQDEETEPGVFHNSAERVIVQSVICLAEELIRTAWANKVIERRGRNLNCRVEKHDVFRVLLERPEFDIFTNEGLGKAVT